MIKLRERRFNYVIKELAIDNVSKNNLYLACTRVYMEILNKLNYVYMPQEFANRIDNYLCELIESGVIPISNRDIMILNIKRLLFNYILDNFYMLQADAYLKFLTNEEQAKFKVSQAASLVGLKSNEIFKNNNLSNALIELSVKFKVNRDKRRLRNLENRGNYARK